MQSLFVQPNLKPSFQNSRSSTATTYLVTAYGVRQWLRSSNVAGWLGSSNVAGWLGSSNVAGSTLVNLAHSLQSNNMLCKLRIAPLPDWPFMDWKSLRAFIGFTTIPFDFYALKDDLRPFLLCCELCCCIATCLGNYCIKATSWGSGVPILTSTSVHAQLAS